MQSNVIIRESTPDSCYVIHVDSVAETKYITREKPMEVQAIEAITNYLKETIDLFKQKRHELFSEQ